MRPILVLLLVLAAVGALLFAISTLDSGGGPKPELGPAAPPVVPAVAPQPVALEGAGAGNQRMSTPVSNVPDRVGGVPADLIQFDNKLTGLVRSGQGQPVAGAEVVLSTMESEELFFVNDVLPDPTREPRARTDAEGRYAFPAIEPRTYTLIVSHPQFATRKQRTTPVAEAGVTEEPVIVLAPGATLTGYVRDEGGNVVDDAVLWLDDQNYAFTGQAPPDRLEATTDAQGLYAFVNVAPGPRALIVRAPGYGQVAIPGLVFEREQQMQRDVTLKIGAMICGKVIGPGSKGLPAVTVIVIGISATQQSARDTVTTDQQGAFCFESLIPGRYNILATAKGWRTGVRPQSVETGMSNVLIEMIQDPTVCGRAVDAATGAPLPAFNVRLRFDQGSGAPTQLASEEVRDFTGPSGEFCVEGVAPATYVVEVQAVGFAPGFSPPFDVTPGQPVSGINVRLSRGGSISGRIVDREGRPVARARVTSRDNEWTDDEFTRALGSSYPTNCTLTETRTDEQGRFTLANLAPETYQLNVQAAGFMLLVRRDVRASDGADNQLGDIRLGKGGTVRGTLFDAAGKMLPGGTIQLRLAEGDWPYNYRTKSGADGKFALQNVVPGAYMLLGASPSGEGNPFQVLGEARGSEVRVLVSEGEATAQDLHLSN